jgi:hypothetical protein
MTDMRNIMVLIASRDSAHCIDQCLIIIPESEWDGYNPANDARITGIIADPYVMRTFVIPFDADWFVSDIGDNRPYIG